MYVLTTSHLKQLCELNEFPVSTQEMVFVGLRGCQPVHPTDHTFCIEHPVEAAHIDYLHPRCTLIQWLPNEGTFAVYPGSTVPHRRYMRQTRERGGQGATELLTGYYGDFRTGMHRAGSPRRHEAFLQTAARPFWRTIDDLAYGVGDMIDEAVPGDDLHAAWCGSMNDDSFFSAGCQVVVGYPACPARRGKSDTGPWKAFHDVAYARPQRQYGYALVNGAEMRQLIVCGPDKLEKVRFGSEGERARRVQEALAFKGIYEGAIDGVFGPRSLRALIEFQARVLGPSGGDGICGPQTAATLGLCLCQSPVSTLDSGAVHPFKI